MEHGKITVGGEFVCYVVNHNDHYEIVFPPDDTLKSVRKFAFSDVLCWLDDNYGIGEWVVT